MFPAQSGITSPYSQFLRSQAHRSTASAGLTKDAELLVA